MKYTKKDEEYYKQLIKLQSYPEDRICFRHSRTIAKMDAAVFNKYINKKITKDQAKAEVARNNCLDLITDEQWFNTLHMLGYGGIDGQQDVHTS